MSYLTHLQHTSEVQPRRFISSKIKAAIKQNVTRKQTRMLNQKQTNKSHLTEKEVFQGMNTTSASSKEHPASIPRAFLMTVNEKSFLRHLTTSH